MENLIPVGILILCLAGAVAFLALAYFLFIMVKVIRNVVFEKVNPLLNDAKDLMGQVKPIMGRVDPMMERITLTIDAANLEIMRVDQIMEDVNNITGNIANASSSMDKVTSAPLNAVSKLTTVLRERINPLKGAEGTAGTVFTNVDTGLECVGEKVATMQQDNEASQAERKEAKAARDETMAKTNETAANLKEMVFIKANTDSYKNN